LIIGTWTISNRSILLGDHQQEGKILLNLFAATLAAAGLLLTCRLQGSVAEAHAVMNRARKIFGVDEIEYNSKYLIPEWWKLYDLDKDHKYLGLIPQTALKKVDKKTSEAPSGCSWWGIYNFLYIVMFVISLLFVACAFYQ